MKKIILIEDDENLRRGLAFALEKDGYQVQCGSTAAQARALLSQPGPPDLILLDIGLPDGDGLSLCGEIRAQGETPVILLTARNLETDEVAGLLAGADDYVTKPFSLSVLRARVEALLRRTSLQKSPASLQKSPASQLSPAPKEPSPDPTRATLVTGAYRLDTARCTLYQNGEEIPVSATEYRLLFFFMTHPGQVLSKEQILSALWDAQENYVDENTLPVNISRLRAKIEENPKQPQTIKTVYAVGYLWNAG